MWWEASPACGCKKRCLTLFFDAAAEVVMVDTPADELLARLAAGKVYMGPQAQRAANNFFRKGNLMALRELALRRTRRSGGRRCTGLA